MADQAEKLDYEPAKRTLTQPAEESRTVLFVVGLGLLSLAAWFAFIVVQMASGAILGSPVRSWGAEAWSMAGVLSLLAVICSGRAGLLFRRALTRRQRLEGAGREERR